MLINSYANDDALSLSAAALFVPSSETHVGERRFRAAYQLIQIVVIARYSFQHGGAEELKTALAKLLYLGSDLGLLFLSSPSRHSATG